MPTLPLKATPLPPADAPRELYIQRAFEMIANTAPFDATGHPAMSVPCGMGDGLPVGLMLIGKHFDEADYLPSCGGLRKVRRLEEDVKHVGGLAPLTEPDRPRRTDARRKARITILFDRRC